METGNQNDQKKIWIYTNKWIEIWVPDIVFCETNGDTTKKYMVDGIVHCASGNLAETTRNIDCRRFCRICNHHLVNLAYFDELDLKTHIMTLYYYRDITLKVSAKYMDDLLKKLANKPLNFR